MMEEKTKETKQRKEMSDTRTRELDVIRNLNLSGRRILIAEDNDLNRDVMSGIINVTGALTETAKNGKETVEKLCSSEAGYFDMILMDIRMPLLNGYEASMEIRKSGHPDAKTIPIIAMTANSYAEDVMAAGNAGMNAHLSKPIEFDKLGEILKYWLE